ncbi:MAG: RsmF rRNA methyltransferase first C-terminal domain-containing protein [Clostridia bacterium]|nr:RsmF rRNA methyltransferase first C-terminal domain-containing protein [Clostridia bacterium]
MKQVSLPKEFIERMKIQLPENEWEAFFAVYQNKPHKGVRLNPLKGGMAALKSLLPFLGEPVSWEKNGFYTEEEKLGASPFHAAGVFYSQEPSAMCAAPLLEVQAGERVLDLCSAPGGKGTQLACAMSGEGVIVLNEPVSARAKILSQNVERMGIKNAVVLNELPENISAKFAGYFDKILVDAPCSGEGMFRKNAEEALGEWSVENVKMCAERQAHILTEATKMLKVGGRLAYSTCTFSEEEDEGQVRDYLKNHPEMRLMKEEKLYPHKIKGEGHFAALFEKIAATAEWDSRIKEAKYSVTPTSEKIYREFEKTFFKEKFAKRLYEVNGVLYDLPEGVFDWKGLQVLRVGVRLGEIKNGRFEPSHSLALCVKKEECNNVLNLLPTDARLQKYFRGETLETTEMEENRIKNGWCIVCVEGYPLGLGKAVSGTIKNHLPKGLRKL